VGTQTAQAPVGNAGYGSREQPRHALAVPGSALVVAVGLAVWLIVDPRTPDLAAQVYRVGLYRHGGFAVWDEHWYAGHALPAYSLLFPPLAALLGMRALAVLCVLCSAVLFERLAQSVYGGRTRWASVWFALAAFADVWVGRLTFALGVSLALAAALAFERGRTAIALALAALCAAGSPVAGLLLALAGLTWALVDRAPRAALVLAAPPAAFAAVMTALFGEGGFEPYPTTSFLATVAVVLGFLWALPARARGLRSGALVYLAACVASLLVHTPMGANVERYGVLLAGPLLLCAIGAERRLRPAPPAIAVLCGIAVWTLWGPVRETAAVAGDPSTSASYYLPVKRFLASHGGDLVRVEVPLTRGHWEAAWLAPSVSLARGWEKQLDERYDGVLLAPGLTAASYERWLREQAVGYVALPDATPDPSSAQEARLIGRGLPYLREVFAGRHWRVYRVLGATPLVQGPGRLSALGHDSFTLRAGAAGRFLVRVRYTRYWTLTQGSGCVARAPGGWIARAPGGWTTVGVSHPGTVVVAARFSLARALGGGEGSCDAGVSDGPFGARVFTLVHRRRGSTGLWRER
jgi:hypothetical protein